MRNKQIHTIGNVSFAVGAGSHRLDKLEPVSVASKLSTDGGWTTTLTGRSSESVLSFSSLAVTCFGFVDDLCFGTRFGEPCVSGVFLLCFLAT